MISGVRSQDVLLHSLKNIHQTNGEAIQDYSLKMLGAKPLECNLASSPGFRPSLKLNLPACDAPSSMEYTSLLRSMSLLLFGDCRPAYDFTRLPAQWIRENGCGSVNPKNSTTKKLLVLHSLIEGL
ncbi:hypothetical protein FRC02_010425 [Tulasnella sp. 418]|nr:hypothetical protein FRC02_010425 [Tulasnella sp. 418]